MSLEFDAVYENGVLKPTSPPPLTEGQHVRLAVVPYGSRVRQTAGLIPWNRSVEELECLARDIENSVLKLDQPLPLAENEQVRVKVREQTSRIRQNYGLMGWMGDPKEIERLAIDTEFLPDVTC